MTEVSPSPPSTTAAASLTRDSIPNRMSHSETSASSPLPPPKNNNKYTTLEVISLSMIYGKNYTINAIDESNYGPKRRALFKMFPKKGEQFNEATIKDLLKDDEIGSKEWYDKIDLISRDVHGPPQSTMYKMFGVDGGGESTEPFEKDATLPNIQPINA